MNGMYFDDFEVGRKFKMSSSRGITETDITDFLKLTRIANPLFTDEEFAKKSIHKGKIAPALLTMALAAGLFTSLGIFEETVMAFLGMDGVRVPVPVKSGDTIKVEVEITEKKETKKPDRGVIKGKSIVMNQRDETVMIYEMAYLIKRRQ